MSLPTNPGSRDERLSEPQLLLPGEMVGRYQVAVLLASGGMGQVWAARPAGSSLARTVALKVIRSDMSGDENYARMFIDEATLASSIHHSNVAEIYELGKHGDRLFMAMEWVAGDSLAGLLRQGDSLVALEAPVAARIIADACAGLHAAHETVGPDGTPLGVVHRDISPPNILISMQGQAKVTDFGIAKARFQLHERTKTGEVKGKFAYIPPEQFTGGPLDRRADVYAMGCVLYVASLGLRPFGNGASALPKILRNDYKRPTQLFPDYPAGLEAIVIRALALSPADRFATAEEMQLALEEWLASTGKLTTASTVAKMVRERLSPEIKQRNEALISQSRAVPHTLISQLVADYDGETPTAGSGLVTAPPGLWRGPKPAQVGTAALPARPSDATALVDFVPDGATETEVKRRLPSAPPPIEEDSKLPKLAALGALMLLLAVALWVWWR
jgi:eukaryotic-like serine/threonine-protein kinase